MSTRILLLLSILFIAACSERNAHEESMHDESGHGEATDEAPIKGAHNGRMLVSGAVALELAIFEQGVPPEYRVWLYREGKLLTPTQGRVEVRLTRLGGAPQRFVFSPREDYLLGAGVVEEPHSFDVEVIATIDGTSASWHFGNYEGRTRIDADVAGQAGIVVAVVAAGTIRDEHEVQGLLTPIEDRQSRVVGRFAGPVLSVDVGVGDSVSAGQRLATVESNISLRRYEVRAPIAGTVLARPVTVGELAGASPLFEIADLSSLWVDLHLFGSDAQHITPGLGVVVTRLSDGVAVETTLDRVLPATATASQSTVARATLTNSDGHWRPGAAVKARVTVAEDAVARAVPLSALQRFRDWDVVFLRVGDTYEIRPLELGRRDGVNVEVLSGVEPGDEIVVEQSYLVKADIEKSGASHDH